MACVTRERGNGTWNEGKEGTQARLTNASQECLVLKCADALDNVRSIRHDLHLGGEVVWQRLRPGKEVSWYYRALSGRFSARLTTAPGLQLSQELAAEIGQPSGRTQLQSGPMHIAFAIIVSRGTARSVGRARTERESAAAGPWL